MLWHIVRFETSAFDSSVRHELVDRLEALQDLDIVGWLRVAHDVEDPDVVGLIVGLVDEDALTAYREHPGHQPLARWLRETGIPAVRLDITTHDRVGALP